jgi:hypothetical protein
MWLVSGVTFHLPAHWYTLDLLPVVQFFWLPGGILKHYVISSELGGCLERQHFWREN